MQRLLRRSWVQVVAGALMLMAVIVLNGRPSVFTDTDDYYAQGRGAFRAIKPLVYKTFHLKTDPDEEQAYLEAEADEDHTSMAARSPYYGILMYGAYRVGTLWLLAATQSLAAAWTVFALIKGAFRTRKPYVYPAVMAGLATLTTLPFFAGFAMPDVFAPLGAITTVALAVYWTRYTLWERLALLVVTTASLWFHTSHVLLEASLVVMIGGVLWWFGADRRTIALRTGTFALLIVSAFASDIAYHTVVRLRTGEDLHRPPFLIARVLADGPGRVYLREACAHATPYVLCRFRANPLDNSDEILWADDPARGIFNASKINIRIALEREEKAFVAATLVHHPVSQLIASLGNWWEQLSLVDLSEPLRDPTYYFTNVYWKDTSLPGLIPDGKACMKAPKLCRPRLSIDVMSWIHGTAILLASGFLIWRVSRRDMRAALMGRKPLSPGGPEAVIAASLLLVMAVIANSAVTGILSGPFARYHARFVWVIPALALVVGLHSGLGFDARAAWTRITDRLRGPAPDRIARR